MEIRRRMSRGVIAVLLLAAGVIVWLGGQTAERLGRLHYSDEVKSRGMAVARSCERHGPVGWEGFGHTWECVVDARQEVEPGHYQPVYVGAFEPSEVTPDDIGRPFRYVEVFRPCGTGGRFPCAGAGWRRYRAEPTEQPLGWLCGVGWFTGTVGGGLMIMLGGIGVVRVAGSGLAGALRTVPGWQRVDTAWREHVLVAGTRRSKHPPGVPPGATGATAVLKPVGGPVRLLQTLGALLMMLFLLLALYDWSANDNPRGALVGAVMGILFGGPFLVSGYVVGRRCLAFDRDRVWKHNGWRWDRPVDLRRVLAVQYRAGNPDPYLVLVEPAAGRTPPAEADAAGRRRWRPGRQRRMRLPMGWLDDAMLRLIGPPLLRRPQLQIDATARRLLESGHVPR